MNKAMLRMSASGQTAQRFGLDLCRKRWVNTAFLSTFHEDEA